VSRVSFGEFVLDPETRELLRGRDAIALSPKAYDLLQLLIDSRPKALSKMALQERLWPDTFVVEKNLVNLVAEIRKALGDDPAHPRFVRTVHRFGYAFRDVVEVSASTRGGPGAAARFRLQWADGRASLGDGEHVLGRDPDLEVFIDGPDVSRRHALIRIARNEATIEDLGSKNGTFVAERLIESPTRIVNGTVIRLGAVPLTFHALAPPGSTVTRSLRD
jgi:DNA-binding winged helix-turn-helix (wHTH) protein